MGGRGGGSRGGRGRGTGYDNGAYGAAPQHGYGAPGYVQAPYANNTYAAPGHAAAPAAGYGMPQTGYEGYPQGGMGGAAAGKKPPKIASHVQFDPSMMVNVSSFLAPGERPAQLASFAISYLPATTPGQPSRVSVYTGDQSGVMREFTHNGTWVQTRKAQHEGPVTSLLAVDVWLFVAIQQSSPSGGVIGVVKAYNLANNTQTTLIDPSSGIPGAHFNSVRCMCAAQQWLITGGGDGQVKAWSFAQDPATGEGKWTLHGMYGGGVAHQNGEVTAMSGKCAGSLITGSGSGELKSWRLVDGTMQAAVQAHVGPIASMDVLSAGPDNQFIVTCGANDSYVRLWKGPTLEKLHELTVQPPPSVVPGAPVHHQNPVTSLKIIQVGQVPQLFVGMWNGTVVVYHMKDVRHFEKLGFVDGHQRKTSILGFELLSTMPFLCMVSDKGFINWFRLPQ